MPQRKSTQTATRGGICRRMPPRAGREPLNECLLTDCRSAAGLVGLILSGPRKQPRLKTSGGFDQSKRASDGQISLSRSCRAIANGGVTQHRRSVMTNMIVTHAGFGQPGVDQPLLDTTVYGSGPEDSVTD